MKLQYTVTKDDFVRFNLYHFSKSPQHRRMLRTMRISFPVLFVCILLLTNRDAMLLAAGIGLVLSAAWIAWLPRSYRGTMRRQVRRVLRGGDAAALLGDRTLELTEDGVRETGESREAQATYGEIRRIGRDEQLLYIYAGEMSAFLVPRSAFRDAEQMEAFLAAIKERCPGCSVE